MLREILGGALILALVLPALADDQEKKKDREKKDELVPAGQFRGTITKVEGSQKNITVKYNGKDQDFPAADNIKTRVANPPADFDDKGNPKKYTAKELKDLKGPENLWGYPSDLDNLKPKMLVQVFLGKKKTTSTPKAKTKDQDKDQPAEDKPQVTVVYILGEGGNTAPAYIPPVYYPPGFYPGYPYYPPRNLTTPSTAPGNTPAPAPAPTPAPPPAKKK